MASEGGDRHYLLERERELWRVEGSETTQNRLDGLNPDSAEAAKERAWQDHCRRRLNEAAWEIDKMVNPQKYSQPSVSLDDLDRHEG